MTEFRINQFTGELDKVRSDDDIRDLMWVIPPVEDSYDPTSGLPSDPSDGDRYISEATANGWTQDYVYEWDAASEEWIEFEPEEGWMVWLLFDMVFWFFFSGGWAEVGSGTYVPYTGATDDVDLGSYDLTTTGVGTFGDNTVVEDVITINIPGYAFGDTGTLKLGGSDNGFGGAWATISAEQDGSPASIKFSGDNFYMSSSYPRFYLENTTDGYSPYFLGSGGGIGFVGGLNDPFFGFLNSSVGQGLFAYVNATNAQMILAPSDGVGNQIVFTNSANYTKDHDHDTTTDPTLFIHSDTNPDSNNTQWLSLSHDKTNGVIESGTGTISFADNDLTTTGDINATSFTNTSPDIDVEWGAGGAGHSSFQWVDSNRFSMRLVGQGTGSPARASSFLQMNAYPDPSNTIRQRFGITFTTASDKWLMYADNTGTGTVSAPLSIYTGSNTDQILLNTDGSVDINGDLTTTGVSRLDGGIGIGEDPTANTPFYLNADIDGAYQILIKNDGDGNNAYSALNTRAENVYTLYLAWGGTSSVTRYGQNVADTSEILAVGGDLVLGTYTPGKDLILGTEQIQAITIDGSNQGVSIDSAYLNLNDGHIDMGSGYIDDGGVDYYIDFLSGEIAMDKSYITTSDPDIEVLSPITLQRAVDLLAYVPEEKKGISLFTDGDKLYGIKGDDYYEIPMTLIGKIPSPNVPIPETKKVYYFDKYDNEVKSMTKPVISSPYKIEDGRELNKDTGEIKDKVSNGG